MRVTNKMLANNYLTDMSANLNNLQRIQRQMSTGKNFTKPSDDPFNVARSMQMHTAIDANTQYNKNITNTINWLDTTDTALNQLGNVFQSIREKLVASGNAAYGSDERTKIKDEINQRIGQIAQILNTTFAGEYVFGGTKGASKPVDASMDSSIGPVDSTLGGGVGTVGGKFYGSGNAKFKIEIAEVNSSGKATKINVSKSTDNGATFKAISSSSIPINKDGAFDIGNDLTFTIADASSNKAAVIDATTKQKTSDGSIYTFDCTSSGNAQLIYCKEDKTELITDPNKATTEDVLQFDMISNKRQTEISQGVLVEYNVSASDVIKYGDGDSDDLRSLLSRIINNLDGKDNDGNSNESIATKALTNDDLADLDKAIKQTLKIRSEVGAKQNRMDSAKEQNVQGNADMTDILSKTEDIDVTEKVMEFATMQTVYLASLQTSAKVLQPTLMDYMR
ncbi:flagellar hook protein [Clostridium carboxidivorans P7]|uniref:Flagellar hook-associated protein 3 n=1 Tax=Clostridium carboxidivorans P7 TaxID=536227 RepID=C6PPJ6_9CLOT|nr:flagellar hook-associated protein FlgL [Clostridium carboxidivorans]AKN33911.1 flagellar hook protein [Clostridium carboxidivorans P7]EET88890.1 flagellar hook-associated protein 3 [Clostridium carboxidivorans P7]EFG88218.1 flagellar hook-associated protein 3 [Clostridium carboxidivorans P7]